MVASADPARGTHLMSHLPLIWDPRSPHDVAPWVSADSGWRFSSTVVRPEPGWHYDHLGNGLVRDKPPAPVGVRVEDTRRVAPDISNGRALRVIAAGEEVTIELTGSLYNGPNRTHVPQTDFDQLVDELGDLRAMAQDLSDCLNTRERKGKRLGHYVSDSLIVLDNWLRNHPVGD